MAYIIYNAVLMIIMYTCIVYMPYAVYLVEIPLQRPHDQLLPEIQSHVYSSLAGLAYRSMASLKERLEINYTLAKYTRVKLSY